MKDKKYFLDTYLRPTIREGLIEMTIPEKPNSPLQRYHLTDLGAQLLREFTDNKNEEEQS